MTSFIVCFNLFNDETSKSQSWRSFHSSATDVHLERGTKLYLTNFTLFNFEVSWELPRFVCGESNIDRIAFESRWNDGRVVVFGRNLGSVGLSAEQDCLRQGLEPFHGLSYHWRHEQRWWQLAGDYANLRDIQSHMMRHKCIITTSFSHFQSCRVWKENHPQPQLLGLFCNVEWCIHRYTTLLKTQKDLRTLTQQATWHIDRWLIVRLHCSSNTGSILALIGIIFPHLD